MFNYISFVVNTSTNIFKALHYTKKNTPSCVLLKSCQKQLKVTARAGVDRDSSCLLVSIWGWIN